MRRRPLREPEACSWSTPDLGPIPTQAGPIKPQPTSPKRVLPPEVAALIRKIGLEAYYNHSSKDGSVKINGKYLYVSPLTVKLGAPVQKTYAQAGRAKQGTDVTPAQGATPGGVGVGRWAGRPAGWRRRGGCRSPLLLVQPGALGDARLDAIVARLRPDASRRDAGARMVVRSLLRNPSAPVTREQRRLVRAALGVQVARLRAWAKAKHAAALRRAA